MHSVEVRTLDELVAHLQVLRVQYGNLELVMMGSHGSGPLISVQEDLSAVGSFRDSPDNRKKVLVIE